MKGRCFILLSLGHLLNLSILNWYLHWPHSRLTSASISLIWIYWSVYVHTNYFSQKPHLVDCCRHFADMLIFHRTLSGYDKYEYGVIDGFRPDRFKLNCTRKDWVTGRLFFAADAAVSVYFPKLHSLSFGWPSDNVNKIDAQVFRLWDNINGRRPCTVPADHGNIERCSKDISRLLPQTNPYVLSVEFSVNIVWDTCADRRYTSPGHTDTSPSSASSTFST